MPRPRVTLNSVGVAELLHAPGVRAMLTAKAESVAGRARAISPVDTGAYAASIHVVQATTDRAVVRVAASVPYALGVESRTGTLARALSAGGF